MGWNHYNLGFSVTWSQIQSELIHFSPAIQAQPAILFVGCTGEETCVFECSFREEQPPQFPTCTFPGMCHLVTPPCTWVIGWRPKAVPVGLADHWPWNSLVWELCLVQGLPTGWWLNDGIRLSFTFGIWDTQRAVERSWESSKGWEKLHYVTVCHWSSRRPYLVQYWFFFTWWGVPFSVSPKTCPGFCFLFVWPYKKTLYDVRKT